MAKSTGAGDIKGGVALIIVGFVVFLIFTIFAPLFLSFWGTVPTDNMSVIGTSSWGYIPDFIAIGGMLLAFGIFIIGILRAVGVKVF